MADEVKILNSPKDFDPPQKPKDEDEKLEKGLHAPAPDFDELRWLLSQ